MSVQRKSINISTWEILIAGFSLLVSVCGMQLMPEFITQDILKWLRIVAWRLHFFLFWLHCFSYVPMLAINFFIVDVA